MLSHIFPKQFDNDYGGYRLGLWLLAPIAFVILTQGVVSQVMPGEILMTADRIPVDAYDKPAADTVIALFALTALRRTIVPLLCLLALVRYRAMVPLMYLLLLFLDLGARLTVALHPIARNDAPATGFSINLALLALTLIGFALSVSTPRTRGVTASLEA